MIEPGDILPDDMMVMPETGEIVPKPVPGQYTEEGAPYWDFKPGEVFPMTGEVVAPGCSATIYCSADHLQKPPPVPRSKNPVTRFIDFLNRVWP